MPTTAAFNCIFSMLESHWVPAAVATRVRHARSPPYLQYDPWHVSFDTISRRNCAASRACKGAGAKSRRPECGLAVSELCRRWFLLAVAVLQDRLWRQCLISYPYLLSSFCDFLYTQYSMHKCTNVDDRATCNVKEMSRNVLQNERINCVLKKCDTSLAVCRNRMLAAASLITVRSTDQCSCMVDAVTMEVRKLLAFRL